MTPETEARFLAALKHCGYDVNDSARLANAVKRMSDHYIHHVGAPSPWHEPFSIPATLAYFMPLNMARLARVFNDVRRFLPASIVSEVWDMGSGLGTTQWVLEEFNDWPPTPIISLEKSLHAERAYADLRALAPTKWAVRAAQKNSKPGSGALAVFSYSYLEMASDISAFDHVLILEPSLQNVGRELLQCRQKWIEQGYHVIAPCTHDRACPLYTKSKRDWCHQRIEFKAPSWWSSLEDNLPMKNRTLTYSYLLLSQTAKPSKTFAGRVIGDTLVENGKTRQMICRGPEREFFSWLHKNGRPEPIPSGALINDWPTCEKKGDELRVSSPVNWEL